MKLTRRKFFAGLAVAPLVAVAVAKAVPALDDYLATWEPTQYFGHTTIQTSLPVATWRKLYSGIAPEPSSYWWETEEGAVLMRDTNEILSELKWIDYDKN